MAVKKSVFEGTLKKKTEQMVLSAKSVILFKIGSLKTRKLYFELMKCHEIFTGSR